jgi:hypothetical protein
MMRALTQSRCDSVQPFGWGSAPKRTAPHGYCTLTRTASGRLAAQFRLATHLSCAFVIYSSLLYSALSLVLPKLAAPSAAALPAALAAHPRVRALRAMTLGSAALIGTTIVSGTALARYTLFGYGTGPLYPVRVRHWPAIPCSDTALARYTLFAEPHMVCVIPPLWRGMLCVAPL